MRDEVAALDSFDRSHPSSAAGRAYPDNTLISHPTATVELLRSGLGDPHQWGIPHSARTTQAFQETVAIRGLNKNHNRDLKNIFKGAATRAAATAGPFQEFYEARIASGMKPPMARLTLARKIAAITLLVWKKGVRFDAEQLRQQAA